MTSFNIREPLPHDVPFIYATWLESYRYDSSFGKSHRNHIFFTDYRLVVDDILQRAKVLVACHVEDPDLIFAYLVYETGVLHYAFTKGPFRKLGIFNKLFNEAFKTYPVQYTHKTYSAIPIIDNFGDDLIFRGTLLLKKGDHHGETPQESAA